MNERYSIVPVTGVKIDLIQVPENKRHLPKFRSELLDLCSKLSQPDYLDLFSLHETGHVVYFEKAGVTEFEYLSPLVAYIPSKDGKAEDFLGQWAAVKAKTVDIPPNVDTDEEDFKSWILGFAKGYAAGGVISKRLTTTSYGGDRNDRRQFGAFCEAVRKDYPTRKDAVDDDGLWMRAQEEVNRDLNNRDFEQTVSRRMKYVRQRLYFSSCV